MGGRGASGSNIESRINTARRRVETLGNKMEQIAREKSQRTSAMPSEYYAAQREYNAARKELNKLLDQRRAEQQKVEVPTQRTFVNSYGEATTRYITTSTYERARKRAQQQVEDFLGIPRRKRRKR